MCTKLKFSLRQRYVIKAEWVTDTRRRSCRHGGQLKVLFVSSSWSCSVQSRWCLCTRKKETKKEREKKAYALHTVYQRFLQRCLWNSSNVCLTIDPSRPSKKDRLALPLSTPLSSRRSMMPLASIVPPCKCLKLLNTSSHLWWVLCPPSIWSVICLHSGMSREVHCSSFHRYRRVCQCSLSERWYLYRSHQQLPVSVCTWLFRPAVSDR